MPRKSAPEPSLRPWTESWLRLLAPTDHIGGLSGRVIAGLRSLATVSVLLAFVILVWVGVGLVVCTAWQLVHQGRLGAALVSLVGGATAAAWRSRRRKRQRPDTET